MEYLKILKKYILVVKFFLLGYLLIACKAHHTTAPRDKNNNIARLTDVEETNIKAILYSPGFNIFLLNDGTLLDTNGKEFHISNNYKYSGRYKIYSDSIIELWTEKPGMQITLNYVEDLGESLLITFDRYNSKCAKDIPIYVGGTSWSVGINDSIFSAWQPLSDYKLSGFGPDKTLSNQVLITYPGKKIERIRFKSDNDIRYINGSSNFSLNLIDLSANSHLNVVDGRRTVDFDKTPNVIIFHIDNLNIYQSPLRGKIVDGSIIIIDNSGQPTDLELKFKNTSNK